MRMYLNFYGNQIVVPYLPVSWAVTWLVIETASHDWEIWKTYGRGY